MLTTGWSDEADIRVYPPKPAEIRDLSVYHDRDYVEFILDLKTSGKDVQTALGSEYGIEEVRLIFSIFMERVRDRSVDHHQTLAGLSSVPRPFNIRETRRWSLADRYLLVLSICLICFDLDAIIMIKPRTYCSMTALM